MRVEATLGGTLAGVSEWANTYQFMLNQAPAGMSALQAAANAAGTSLAASTPVKAGLCTDTSLGFLKLAYYANDVAPATYVVQAPVGGSGSVAPVHAPQVAVVASTRTNLAGRSFRGRIYVPYRGSNVTAAGVVLAAGQTAVGAHVNNVQSAIITGLAGQSMGSVWSVWSGKLGGGTAIRSIFMGTQCDTQRRRNPNGAESYTPIAPLGPMVLDGSPDQSIIDQAIRDLVKVRRNITENLPQWPEEEPPLPVEVLEP